MAYTPYYDGGWQNQPSGNTPITADALNHMEDGIIHSAPSGFGIGTGSTTISGGDDLNDYNLNGWYCWGDPAPANAPYTWGYMLVMNFGGGASTQIVTRSYGNLFVDTVMMRSSAFVNGVLTWSAWEYANPPLVAGQEYRTTERYLGKPVYVRVNSLTTPTAANTETSTAFGSNVDKVVSAGGIAIGTFGGANYEFTIPYKDAALTINGGAFAINGYVNYVYSYTNASFVWASGYVIAKYTKTTD